MSARALAIGALAAAAAVAGCGARRETAPPPPAAGPEAPGAMVRLPGGTFRAGELTGPRPREIVTYQTVRPFRLDVTEVAVAAYGACVAAGRCRPSSTVEWEAISDADRATYSRHCNGGRADRADHPMNCVDWSEAAAYCAWAGKRLPTEAELEWAARNGKRATTYPWGDEAPGDRACWSGAGNDAGLARRAGTCPAGSRPAGDSAAGVKDLAGNVWEWTSSVEIVLSDGRGRGGTEVKVARGGGWSEVDPASLSASVRLLELPSLRRGDLGFRCASAP